MKYTLDTKPYRQFFNYYNTFHFPDESGSIYYVGEDSSVKEVSIQTQLIDNSNLAEGSEEEVVLLYIPEIPGPIFYCSRMPAIIEE
jgi:hypothetical protein